MANLRQIQTKIKSVSNLTKITKALEIVSTIKLQKTKDRAEALRNYLLDLMSIFTCLGEKIHLFKSKLRHTEKELAVVVTTDRGQCGSLNTKLLRQFTDETLANKANTDVFVIGKKGLSTLKMHGYNVVGVLNVKDNFTEFDLLPLYEYLVSALEKRQHKVIKIYFNLFKNSLIQIPKSVQIFPMSQEAFNAFMSDLKLNAVCEIKVGNKELVIEPDEREYMREIYRQIRNYITYSAIVQNKAGEHAARMIAMKSAKDNGTAVIDSLTLSFNKARQAAVTQEISEIVSAKIAME